PRSHRLQGGRGATILPDEPRYVGRRRREHDRERLLRALHQGTTDGVCGGTEPADSVGDGGFHRITVVRETMNATMTKYAEDGKLAQRVASGRNEGVRNAPVSCSHRRDLAPYQPQNVRSER